MAGDKVLWDSGVVMANIEAAIVKITIIRTLCWIGVIIIFLCLSINLLLDVEPVAAPKLTKIANESSGVRVYWSKVGGADGYYLYRRVAGSKTWTKVASIKKGSTTSYLDKKASVGKTYEYIIKCYDGSTPSAAAAKTIKIKRLTVPKLVSTSSSKTGITFKWGKVSGAEGYLVYRKTGSGSWVKLTTVKGNTKVSYVDKSAKKGTKYSYKVKAFYSKTTSDYSRVKSVTDKY